MSFDFKDLKIWQESMILVEVVYRLTAQLPNDEKFGLQSQMRRAVISIPSNIAEGKGRSTGKDFRSFLICARSSLLELQTQLEICFRLKYIDHQSYCVVDEQMIRLSRMLSSFIRSLS